MLGLSGGQPIPLTVLIGLSEGTTPIYILREGSTRNRGHDAQRNNIMAARTVAEIIRTTLGPLGMSKMLVAGVGDIVITSDGATIMKEFDIQHPAAKMLVEVAKSQDNEVGDGTTTAVVLAGELLSKAEELMDQDVHPTIIIDGYKKASAEALQILASLAITVDSADIKTLRQIASTSMGTKAVATSKDFLATLATSAITQVMDNSSGKTKADIERIKVLKKHGEGIEQTELIKGIVLDKEIAHPGMPKRVEKARIALLNAKLEIEKTEFDAKITIESPDQMKMFLDEEETMMRQMVEKIAESKANVVLSEKGIDDVVLHYLARRGILAVKNVSSGDMEKLGRATGGKIVASLKDLSAESLGEAKLVEEVKIGDDKLLYIRECKDPKAVTIVIRGGSEHVIEEAERSLHDGLCVVRNVVEDGKIVAGGGSIEAELAKQLRDFAVKVGGREQLAVQCYAEAVESIAMTLAQNAGLDPIDIMVELRMKHQESANKWFGVSVRDGKVADMLNERVVEPLRVKQQAIKSSTEVACMILRIDDVVSSKGGKGPAGGPPGGGMPPGMGMM
ncbi:MAG: thermosome subunit alpha [Candidatus Bathyarchaeia archaeon]